jgi:flagellar motility protein MotE (MotC chaperone)
MPLVYRDWTKYLFRKAVFCYQPIFQSGRFFNSSEVAQQERESKNLKKIETRSKELKDRIDKQKENLLKFGEKFAESKKIHGSNLLYRRL